LRQKRWPKTEDLDTHALEVSYSFARRSIPFDRRSCCILVVHICAPAHLTKWVFGVGLGGLAKRVGPRRGNSTFYGMDDMSPRGGGTTDRGRLVSMQKIDVFLPR
jgi:hypothetical protein